MSGGSRQARVGGSYPALLGGQTRGGEVPRGNTEYLMDSANFLMMEFNRPQLSTSQSQWDFFAPSRTTFRPVRYYTS